MPIEMTSEEFRKMMGGGGEDETPKPCQTGKHDYSVPVGRFRAPKDGDPFTYIVTEELGCKRGGEPCGTLTKALPDEKIEINAEVILSMLLDSLKHMTWLIFEFFRALVTSARLAFSEERARRKVAHPGDGAPSPDAVE